MVFNIFMAFNILACNSLVYYLNKNDISNYKQRDSSSIIIPREAVNDREVELIVENNLKKFKLNYTLTSLIIFMSIPLSTEINIAIILGVLDIFLILFVVNNVKSQKKVDIYVEEYYINLNDLDNSGTYFDISIVGKTDEMMIGLKWFSLPIALNFVFSCIILLDRKIDIEIFLYINLIYLAITFFIIYIYNTIKKQKNKVYSVDSELNLKINTVDKGNTSKILFFTSLIDTVIFAAIWLMIVRDISTIYFLLIMTVILILLLSYMIKLNNNTQKLINSIPYDKRVQNSYLSNRNKLLFGGLILYDDTNKRSLRDSSGMNYVPNVATLGGKIWGALTGLCLLFMLILPFWMITSAFTSVNVILDNDVMTFKYMEYTKTISIDEIESYSLLSKYPDIQIKLNGIGTEEKRIGTFKVSGFGKSELYLTKDNLPVLYIKTNVRSYFVNSSRKVDIKIIYDILDNLKRFN